MIKNVKEIFHELITVPKSKNYNPVLAGAKSLAFIWICSLHVIVFFDIPIGIEHSQSIAEFRNNPIVAVITAGTYAVEIFMVLSGYLLAQDLWHHYESSGRINTWQILLQRMIRLYPTFLFMVVIQTISFSKICPCIWELAWIRTGSDGCLPTVWSSIVDFQTWAIIVPVFALLCSHYGRSRKQHVRYFAILYGVILSAIWVFLRVYQAWRQQYEMKILTGRHLPAHLFEYMQEAYPYAPWHLTGDYRDPELEKERVLQNHFADSYYLSFFMKYGALAVGFALYLLIHPVKDNTSKEPQHNTQPSAFQQFVFNYHLPLFLFSLPTTMFLLTVLPHPATQNFTEYSQSFQMIYVALHRPLFVAIFCIFFTIVLSVPQHADKIPWKSFYSTIYSFLSWNIWYFVAKISYAGYYWNLPMCAIISIQIYPIDMECGTPLPYQYMMAGIIMFALLIPQSVITHVLIEQPATKWLRVKLNSKPSRMEYDSKLSKTS